MNQDKPFYELNRRGRKFVIYRMEYTETGGMGSPVYQTNNYEDARKKLYELNGWKYKPKENRHDDFGSELHGGQIEAHCVDETPHVRIQ